MAEIKIFISSVQAAYRHRFIFIKQSDTRQPKENDFIRKIEQQVVRKSFSTYEE